MTTTETICNPWRAFKYNSTKATSPRHAGKALAQDLKVHNRTGENLKCWKAP